MFARKRRFCFITLWVLYLSVLTAADVAAEALPQRDNQSLTRYQRVALALLSAPEAQRRTFAQIAVNALAEVYIAEADLARSEARGSLVSNKKLHWASSVDRFTDKLLAVSAALQGGAGLVLVATEPRSPIALTVGDQRLILSHPRERQQAVFEQAVLVSFCRMGACDELLPSVESDAIAPISSQLAQLEWKFSADGVSCSREGLRLSFNSKAAIPQVREFCQQIHREVASLFGELRRQAQQGVMVKLHALSIERRTDQPGHVVRLNSVGDAALLRLPLIAASAEFLQLMGVWFAQKLQQQAPVVLELQAADYDWPGS